MVSPHLQSIDALSEKTSILALSEKTQTQPTSEKSTHAGDHTRRLVVQSHSMEYRIKAWLSSSVCSRIWIGHPSPFTS